MHSEVISLNYILGYSISIPNSPFFENFLLHAVFSWRFAINEGPMIILQAKNGDQLMGSHLLRATNEDQLIAVFKNL